jgi:DnaJ-class molecular chaperone
MSNPYDILCIDKNASKEDIKRAYRKLSLEHHPDRNGGSEESTRKFQEINAAYERLTNQQNNINTNNIFTGQDINVNDLMKMFARGGIPEILKSSGMQARMHRPVPIIKTITITMEQAFTGCSIPIDIERWILENNTRKKETETIYVDIPRGVDKNEIIIISEKGNVIDTGNMGDIKIFVNINNSEYFERRGLDIIYKQIITLKQCLCGFSFDIKHLSGKSYRINNKRGNVIALSSTKTIGNLGFIRNGHTGSMIVEFIVDMPSHLSEEQVKVLENIL